MHVNVIVALMKSHQFAQAVALLQKVEQDCHPAILGLQVFFKVRERKYEEALQVLQGREDPYSVFLRVHIYMQSRRPELAIDTLLRDIQTFKPVPEPYLQMLIKSCLTL
jgi:hypothetical protein